MAGQDRTVMLLGSTGLVGGELLRLLLADDSVVRVVAPGRRAERLSDSGSGP